MIAVQPRDLSLAYLFLRVGTGINLFLHGYVRTGEGWEPFREYVYGLFAASSVPDFLLWLSTYLIPGVEIAVGAALVLGIFTRWALSGASLLMLALLAGMATIQKWDVVGMQMQYLLVYFVLLAFASADKYSVDGWYR